MTKLRFKYSIILHEHTSLSLRLEIFKSRLGLPSWRNNPPNHKGSDNKWQSQQSKISLFQKWNSLNPKFGHYCVICRPDSLFDRNFWLGSQVAFVDGYSKTLGQNWSLALRKCHSSRHEVTVQPMNMRQFIMGSVSVTLLVYLLHGLQWKRMDSCSALPRCVTVRVQLGEIPTASLTWSVLQGLGKCQTM